MGHICYNKQINKLLQRNDPFRSQATIETAIIILEETKRALNGFF